MEQPWLEKYRPTVLKDVVGNCDTIARLKVIGQEGNMPNFIVSGPPGTGKTTSIHCLARALLGPELYKVAVLELNASDARGIDVVRNNIKSFAQRKITLPPGRHKIIILDEADNMTSGAQQALRRTMEIYSNSTRFALACNISSKIIEPIQSRCAILRYTRLEDKEVLKRMMKVMSLENVLSYQSDGLEAILFIAEGDMRKALNACQSTFAGFGAITSENVFKVCDQPHPVALKSVLDDCVKGNINDAILGIMGLLNKGYSPIDTIGTIFKVVKSFNTHEKVLLDWIKEIAFTHMHIAEGINSNLQLTGLLAKLCLIARGYREKGLLQD